MSEDTRSVIAVGEKLHLMARRLFDGDLRRHFVGVVTAVSGALLRLEGHVFVFYPERNEYIRREGLRTRIVALGDPHLIVNVLPSKVVIEHLHYSYIDRRLELTDGRDFALDINEFSSTH